MLNFRRSIPLRRNLVARLIQIFDSITKNHNCLFKMKFGTYNHFHNILRLSDVLPTFPFTTSETMRDYYL